MNESITNEYRSRHLHSQHLFERAQRALPGGQTRSVTHFEPFPVVLSHASGPVLVDVDGCEYLDVLNNYTSLIHGNTFEPVITAVTDRLGKGVAFPAIHEEQLRLATAITDRLHHADMVRFTNSGSEASALAIRIARHATGRRTVVMAANGYHGSVSPFADAHEPGVVRVPFNDSEALAETLTDQTAAVILEPFQGAGGVIPGDASYLRAAQEAARSCGAIFILDEVQSLRNSFHGVQHDLGLTPDLTILGKVIGGGYPIGAVAGVASLLELTSPLTINRIDHSGTFNGHLTAAVAGTITLDHLTTDAIASLITKATVLQSAIEKSASRRGLPIRVHRSGSILNLHPTTDHDRESFYSALHLSLLLEGIYAAPRGMLNLSTVLDENRLEDIAAGYDRALDRIAASRSVPT